MLKYKSFIIERVTKFYKLKTKWPIDIDDPEDLKVTEAIIKSKKNKMFLVHNKFKNTSVIQLKEFSLIQLYQLLNILFHYNVLEVQMESTINDFYHFQIY